MTKQKIASCISLDMPLKKRLQYRSIEENRPACSIVEQSLKEYVRKPKS